MSLWENLTPIARNEFICWVEDAKQRMNSNETTTAADGRDLVLTRIINAPREDVYRAWTDPELLKQWFVPQPWTVSKAETDVRPGGVNLIVMQDPDGNDMPNPGVYLEVIENERLVITDAYTVAWEPSNKPFMTLVLTFVDRNGQTEYTARAKHWSIGDREEHEKLGFHEGWTQCAEQLAALVEKS